MQLSSHRYTDIIVWVGRDAGILQQYVRVKQVADRHDPTIEGWFHQPEMND